MRMYQHIGTAAALGTVALSEITLYGALGDTRFVRGESHYSAFSESDARDLSLAPAARPGHPRQV